METMREIEKERRSQPEDAEGGVEAEGCRPKLGGGWFL